MLTLDQLKRRGLTLVNRCFLCEEEEDTIEHLLMHCSRANVTPRNLYRYKLRKIIMTGICIGIN